MINTIRDWELDIWGLSETNIIWHNTNKKHHWKERTRAIALSQSNFAYNKHESLGSEKFLPGGVGQIATTNLSGRIVEHGHDSLGLGR